MTNLKCRNVFSGLPAAKTREVFRTLVQGKGFKIERIVSSGQRTPEGKWLCSKGAEWVIVLRGEGHLRFQKGARRLVLKAGDSVFIPANTRHRVDRTSPQRKTLWLAVYIK